MGLRMTAVMTLRMVLAVLTAAARIGVQFHCGMVLAAEGFRVYIRGHGNIAQYEQQGQ